MVASGGVHVRVPMSRDELLAVNDAGSVIRKRQRPFEEHPVVEKGAVLSFRASLLPPAHGPSTAVVQMDDLHPLGPKHLHLF